MEIASRTKMRIYFVFVNLLIVLVLSLQCDSFQDPLIAETTSGLVQGERLSCGDDCKYFSFKGIPYAAPPLGKLRFRDPVPHPRWEGVRLATEHGSNCAQKKWGKLKGAEDCLFMNVYSPNITKLHPVMFYVHGGTLKIDDGDSDTLGPEFFLQDDVVFVTFNYRLNAFGFLSTSDQFAQGNYGMKDMVHALKWTRQNIRAFGGDPDNITLFGHSAGATCVHLLMLSKMATGLYKKGILMSASALTAFAMQPDPRKYAYELGESVGINSSVSTEQLVDLLRDVPFEKLTPFGNADHIPITMGVNDLGVVIEHEDSSFEPRFLTEHPLTTLQNGDFSDVPLIIGFTNFEYLFKLHEDMPNDDDVDLFVPVLWNVPKGSPQARTIADTFKEFYWNRLPLSECTRQRYGRFVSDGGFVYGVDKAVRLHYAKQKENIYLYEFIYDGLLNGFKKLFRVEDIPGASHVDDIFYLFNFTDIDLPVVSKASTEYRVRARMVRMWTNFAKYSDPTHYKDDLITTKWIPYSENREYMEIGRELIQRLNPQPSNLNLWRELEEKYANF